MNHAVEITVSGGRIVKFRILLREFKETGNSVDNMNIYGAIDKIAALYAESEEAVKTGRMGDRMAVELLIVKKYAYNPFDEGELIRCGAATGETFGTMTFLLAAGINPVLTGPVTSSYCIVTIILARIFLKERLTKKQYISLAFLLFGIALLGISDIFNV